MLRTSFVLLMSGLCIAGAVGQSLNAVPVHDVPVWQQVQAVQGAQVLQQGGTAMLPVKSMTTHQVLGYVPVGHKFLSFGSAEGIVTMAFNGEIGYLPSATVARVYPSTTPPPKPPAGPVTLETLAEEYVARVETGAGVSLEAESSIVQQVQERESSMQQLQAGGVGTLPGTNAPYGTGVDQGPNSIQPGAALATGGPQALGGMVNPNTGLPGK